MRGGERATHAWRSAANAQRSCRGEKSGLCVNASAWHKAKNNWMWSEKTEVGRKRHGRELTWQNSNRGSAKVERQGKGCDPHFEIKVFWKQDHKQVQGLAMTKLQHCYVCCLLHSCVCCVRERQIARTWCFLFVLFCKHVMATISLFSFHFVFFFTCHA